MLKLLASCSDGRGWLDLCNMEDRRVAVKEIVAARVRPDEECEPGVFLLQEVILLDRREIRRVDVTENLLKFASGLSPRTEWITLDPNLEPDLNEAVGPGRYKLSLAGGKVTAFE